MKQSARPESASLAPPAPAAGDTAMDGEGGTAAGGILGVDPGLRATGWAILRQSDGQLRMEWGVIRPQRGRPVAQRLRQISDGLLAVIDAHHPVVVAVERPFVRENVRTAMALGQAHAAVLLAAAWRDREVIEYAPREVKQVVAGYGAAEKAAMAEALRLELGLQAAPSSVDAADALAVAYCQHILARHPESRAAGR